MKIQWPDFIKIIRNKTFCKEIHIEDYENPMARFYQNHKK